MKFTVSQKDFASALSAVSKLVSPNPIIPALSAAQLSLVVEDGSVRVSVAGGDGDNWVRTFVPAESDGESAQVAVSARLAADLVKDLPEGSLECELVDGALRMEFPGGAYSLPVFAEYPGVVPGTPETSFTVDGALFAEAFSRVSPAVGSVDALPVLACVRLEASESSVALAATDRYRLSSVVVPLVGGPLAAPVSANLEAGNLGSAVKLFAKAPAVQVALSDALVVFSDGVTEVFLRLVGGDFPEWRRLLDGVSPSTWVAVQAQDLLAPVRRAARVSADVVSLTVSADQLEVSGADASRGSGAEAIASTRDGDDDDMTLRFSAEYLVDGLASFGSRAVRLGVSAPERPVLLVDDAGAKHLVMPRR